jgi:hypothetical protein
VYESPLALIYLMIVTEFAAGFDNTFENGPDKDFGKMEAIPLCLDYKPFAQTNMGVLQSFFFRFVTPHQTR